MKNPLRWYVNYLTSEARQHPYLAEVTKQSLPWTLPILIVAIGDLLIGYSESLRWLLGGVALAITLVGLGLVGTIIVREGVAAARREPPRYSE